LGGAEEVVRVEIFWPRTGETQVVEGLELDACYVVREGEAGGRKVEEKRFGWPEGKKGRGHAHGHAAVE